MDDLDREYYDKELERANERIATLEKQVKILMEAHPKVVQIYQELDKKPKINISDFGPR